MRGVFILRFLEKRLVTEDLVESHSDVEIQKSSTAVASEIQEFS